jgi:phage terminase large subunit
LSLLRVNDKFELLYTSNTRYYILTGGRGSGKSFAANIFATHLTYQQRQRILFTRYTMTSAKLSIMPEFQEKISLLNAEAHFDIQLNEIVNKLNGSAVLFKGIKTGAGIQTAALKSLQGITTWILDEAEELVDEQLFDKIDLSVRQKGIENRVILILNPSTKNHWIYKRFFESRGINDGFTGVKGDTTYIHTTYLDNFDNLDEGFLRQVENIRLTNPEKYNHVIMGGWINVAEGAIFTNWITGNFDTTLPYAYGQDYGFSIDPTTLIKVAINEKTKQIFVDELLYSTSPMGTEAIFDANKRLIDKPHDMIIADSAEPRLISDLRNKGLNIHQCEKGQGSVQAGITAMQDYQIVVSERSSNIRKELSNYVWNDKKAGIPVDAFNHAIDAIRYAITRIRTKQVYAPSLTKNRPQI